MAEIRFTFGGPFVAKADQFRVVRCGLGGCAVPVMTKFRTDACFMGEFSGKTPCSCKG
jgi:hypothetical protein